MQKSANPPRGLDFTNDNTSETNKTRIYRALTVLSGYVAMPPSFKLDSCSILKIKYWSEIPIQEDVVDYSTMINLSVYPNPSEGIINVNYNLVEPEQVKFEIYDPQGKIIYSKDMNTQDAGYHSEQIPLEATIPSGVYMLRINIGRNLIVKPLDIIK